MPVVNVPTQQIHDWQTFYYVFADVLGFPDFYGRNMDAWIDCITHADDERAKMIDIIVGACDVLTLQLDDARGFAERCPEQYRAIIECAAFVNWRRIDIGHRPIVAVSFRM